MYHISFIPSSTDGPLGCFRVVAIVNNAAVNAFLFSSDKYRGVELLDCKAVPFLLL